MTTRGILLLARKGAEALVGRALASLAAVHPELPRHVATVTRPADKPRLIAESPFGTTLCLSADAVVLGDLAFGFEMAERYGLACCLSDNPWQRSFVGCQGDAILYDTGVLFLDSRTHAVMDAWSRLGGALAAPLAVVERGVIHHVEGDDRLAFAEALAMSGSAPFVLPANWCLTERSQSSFCGPVRIWRGLEPVPASIAAANPLYADADAILQFHPLHA